MNPKIKKYTILFILFLCPLLAFTQIEEDLIGSWAIEEVEHFEVTDEGGVDMDMVEKVKQAFELAKITVNEDHSFRFDFPLSEMRIRRGYWKFDEYNEQVTIYEWKDRNIERAAPLMEFFIIDIDGYNATIELSEAFFYLELNLKKLQ